MKVGNKGGWIGKALRGIGVLSLAGVAALVLATVAGNVAEDASVVTAEGWGAEATVAIAEGAAKLSPIPLANACGLGASSCFKCHNGKRAPAPEMNAETAPWHAQHAKVNNSCVGCHQGNSRIMKQDVAHAKMISRPRDNSAHSCASCHTNDLSKVQNFYHAIQGGAK